MPSEPRSRSSTLHQSTPYHAWGWDDGMEWYRASAPRAGRGKDARARVLSAVSRRWEWWRATVTGQADSERIVCQRVRRVSALRAWCRARWDPAPHHHERQRQRKRRCVCVVGVRHEVRRRAGAGRGCVLCKRGWIVPLSTGVAINTAGMHAAQACRSALLPWSTPVCISSVDDKRIACISIQ